MLSVTFYIVFSNINHSYNNCILAAILENGGFRNIILIFLLRVNAMKGDGSLLKVISKLYRLRDSNGGTVLLNRIIIQSVLYYV